MPRRRVRKRQMLSRARRRNKESLRKRQISAGNGTKAYTAKLRPGTNHNYGAQAAVEPKVKRLNAANPGTGGNIMWDVWEVECPSRGESYTHNDPGSFQQHVEIVAKDCPDWRGSAGTM